MKMSASTAVAAKPSKVWKVITDIEHAADTISGIDAVEVLEKPKKGVVGLKWKETRTFGGREATEVMWITDAKADAFYATRAESHGAVYLSRFDIEKTDAGCTLTFTFDGTPQTFGAKVMWALTGWMMKGPMRKAVAADLADIKKAAEA